jgi:acetyl esterase
MAASKSIGPSTASKAIGRIAGPVVAGTVALPDAILGPLAGARPTIEGQRVSPALGVICRFSSSIVDAALTKPSALRRATIDLFAGAMTYGAGGPVPTRDVELAGTGLDGRLYTPEGFGDEAPLVLFFHGGGFVFGSAAGHEGTCAYLAQQAQLKVLSVNYPLAPEHPSPAAHDAAVAAWSWVVEHAGELGVCTERIAVGGDSAGGNLAAFVAYGAHDARRPAGAFLLYPVTDLYADDPSTHAFARGLLLTRKAVMAIPGHYEPAGPTTAAPHAVATVAVPDGAPPAFIGVAGMDPLRDQGVRLAEHLRRHGVEVELARYDGVVHGFATLLVVDECRRATDAAASGLRRLLGTTVAAC